MVYLVVEETRRFWETWNTRVYQISVIWAFGNLESKHRYCQNVENGPEIATRLATVGNREGIAELEEKTETVVE